MATKQEFSARCALAMMLSASALSAAHANTCAVAPGYKEVALLGDQRNGEAGGSVAFLGDINGDGLADFAVAAPNFFIPPAAGPMGIAHVIYGAPALEPISLGELGPLPATSPNKGFVVIGRRAGGALPEQGRGGAMRALGDIDGDGFDDFAIGDAFKTGLLSDVFGPGSVTFFFGQAANAGQPAFPSEINLGMLPSGVFGDQVQLKFLGPPVSLFGAAIVGLGDRNGDGRAEFAVGMPGSGELSSFAGSALVFEGNPERQAALAPTLSLIGDVRSARLGDGMAAGFDFDGDTVDDLMVCAPLDRETRSFGGVCYLLWGSGLTGMGSTFRVRDLLAINGGNGARGIAFKGGEDYAALGQESRVLGNLDINGDGRSDLIFGSPFTTFPSEPDLRSGRVFVVYGGISTGLAEMDLTAMASATAGASQKGFVLEGLPDRGANFGHALASAGDVNRDGIDDLLIGAPFGRSCEGEACGQVTVIYGRRGPNAFPPLIRVDAAALAGGLGYAFGPTRAGEYEQFGWALASIPDLNGDGQPEWLVGAPTARVGNGVRGKGCLYYSSNGQVFGAPPVLIDAGSRALWAVLASVMLVLGVSVLRRSTP